MSTRTVLYILHIPQFSCYLRVIHAFDIQNAIGWPSFSEYFKKSWENHHFQIVTCSWFLGVQWAIGPCTLMLYVSCPESIYLSQKIFPNWVTDRTKINFVISINFDFNLYKTCITKHTKYTYCKMNYWFGQQ